MVRRWRLIGSFPILLYNPWALRGGCSDRWGKAEPVSLSARQALAELHKHVRASEQADFTFLHLMAQQQLASLQNELQAAGADGAGAAEVRALLLNPNPCPFG
jgi:hypothetical protein